MLKKSLALGLLAGLMFAPTAALAGDQVAGSSSVTNQSSVNKGVGNTTGQSSITNTVQQQIQKSGIRGGARGGYRKNYVPARKPVNQTAGANSVTGQSGYNRGADNVTGQTSETNTVQKQYSSTGRR
ncbi:hypothetical protein [Iningainema tapete]|uniref:Uncharacterized protein n=1 Tax=Iningainema tapete BLCC-T55 TaxID=2748662 RepID=A0A8J7CDZ7_9CYAN|nr:hypothetical protein [Iningainema tapete]MBD2773145.1 hypothetical protein [Iningainema tapete BLCC-T55]